MITSAPPATEHELAQARLEAATRHLLFGTKDFDSRHKARNAWWAAVYAVAGLEPLSSPADSDRLDNRPEWRDAPLDTN
jgi:hypothetical protein